MYLSNDELVKVVGGISGSLLNAISGLVETIFEIGKTVGKQIKRLFG